MVFEVNVAVNRGFPPFGKPLAGFLWTVPYWCHFGGMGQLGGPNGRRDGLFLEGRSGQLKAHAASIRAASCVGTRLNTCNLNSRDAGLQLDTYQ